MRKISKFIISLFLSFSLTACNNDADVSYNIIENDVEIKDGTTSQDSTNPFGNVGIYTDPEVDIDGVREENYDYPNGSGRHLVYESPTETTYVSLFKGEKGIYFIFECEDDSLSALNVEDINLVTAQSDSVELYMDTYGAGGQSRGSLQYEFRVTTSARVYSYLTGFVARVFTDGTVNDHSDVDKGFVVEGYVSYAVMGEDVNKNTSTSFAFARVTKTGNRGYEWHGAVDPQIPDNYLVLHSDNKFYKLNDCPVNGTINGRLIDVNKEPISGAKVEIEGYKTIYTNSNGEYSIKLIDYLDDVNIKFTKNNYLDNEIYLSKKDIRLASNNTFNIGDLVFLSLDKATYQTTIKGKIVERDGKTPIKGAIVEVNGDKVTTDSNGNYSLLANCYGYENNIIYSHDTHISYTNKLDILYTNINGITDIQTINLDENYGDEIEFGHTSVEYALARVVRQDNSLKFVLKSKAIMDISQFLGSYFEVFIDTKNSSCMNQRDASDYLFCFQYANNGVVDITNYGGQSINANGIKTSYGRINELYYVEVDLPYEKINIAKDEVIGLYFGIKYRWNWAGMYDQQGDYIPAEATINYVRLDKDSNFFIGSCNEVPSSNLSYKSIGRIGKLNSNNETVQYDVSYARENNYVMLRFDLFDNGLSIFDQSHSINIYVDMNCNKNKNNRDESSYHISLYPGKPVSKYCGYDVENNKESSIYYYENETNNTWAYIYNDSLFVKLSTDIFGGDINNSIGFAIGLWNDGISSNSILTDSSHNIDFAKPSTYFIVDSNGNLS